MVSAKDEWHDGMQYTLRSLGVNATFPAKQKPRSGVNILEVKNPEMIREKGGIKGNILVSKQLLNSTASGSDAWCKRALTTYHL